MMTAAEASRSGESAPVQIPYHTGTLSFDCAGHRVRGLLKTEALGTADLEQQQRIVREALLAPIDSPPLHLLAEKAARTVIITSDHTRPVPSRITLPALLEEIRRGNPRMDITIVIATGFHRPSTEAELLEKFGPDILAREHIEIHVSDDLQSMVTAGILPSGGALLVNRLAWECDLLIAEGFIEPHFFAGFSGGRKAVLPGIVSTETVLANHCSEFIDHPLARAGILEGNPIHRDMLSAAGQVGLAFILNVVMNGKKEIVHAVCGHARTAHEAGCAWLASRVTRKAVTADIVITSNGGYPLDQNIYQAVKGMTAAEACCREGGVIIIAAACSDGHGGEAFYRAMRDAPSVESLLAEVLSRSREKTEPDQWEYQILCRILSKFTVVLVSDLCDPKLITGMKLIHAASLDEALDTAYAILSAGNNSRSHAIPEITVIPDGVGIIIDRQE